jgi:hypothetical protein
MVAGVAVFGCFTMATTASVSAQQIGNLQGQPSNAPPTPGTGKPTRANLEQIPVDFTHSLHA